MKNSVDKDSAMKAVTSGGPPPSSVFGGIDNPRVGITFSELDESARSLVLMFCRLQKKGLWIFMGLSSGFFMKSLKSFSSKLDFLEAIGAGKDNSFPKALKDLTEAVNDVETMTEAYSSRFKEVDDKFSGADKRIGGLEDNLKKL